MWSTVAPRLATTAGCRYVLPSTSRPEPDPFGPAASAASSAKHSCHRDPNALSAVRHEVIGDPDAVPAGAFRVLGGLEDVLPRPRADRPQGEVHAVTVILEPGPPGHMRRGSSSLGLGTHGTPEHLHHHDESPARAPPSRCSCAPLGAGNPDHVRVAYRTNQRDAHLPSMSAPGCRPGLLPSQPARQRSVRRIAERHFPRGSRGENPRSGNVFTAPAAGCHPVLPTERPLERPAVEEPRRSRDVRGREPGVPGSDSITWAASSRCSRRYAAGVVPIRSNSEYT